MHKSKYQNFSLKTIAFLWQWLKDCKT